VGVYTSSEDHAGAVRLPALTASHPAERRWDLAFWGILAYLIIEYTRLALMFPFLQNFDVAKIAAGVSALGLVLSPRLKKKVTAIRGIELCLLLFLLASLVSAWFADYPQAAWAQFIDSLKWVVVYFLISRIVVSSWRSRFFVVILLLLNLKLAQFAIRTYLHYGTIVQGGQSVAMVGLGGSDFFGNSNDFGVAMCVVWPVAASLFFGESKILARAFYLLSFLGIFAAMLLSGCRGALVGACAAVFVALARSDRKLAAILMGFLLVLGTLFLLPEGNRDRIWSALSPESDQNASLRIGFWKAGLRMFKDHPLVGVGPGNFAPHYRDRYYGADPFPRAWAPHSIYIQAFAELGLAGGGPLLVLWLLALRLNGRTRKLLRESGVDHRSFESRLALGLELALVAYLVSGAFLTVLYYPHLWFLLGLSAGLRTSCLQTYPASGAAQEQRLEDSVVLATS
jgi:probable O-glycosylation ligase (exosortase A-associated)